MADLAITATSVVQGTDASVSSGIAGETITAGQTVYLNSTDGLLYKADCDDTAAKSVCVGIALNGGAINQPIEYQTDGVITIGATVVVGTIYVVSDTAGGIKPVADLSVSDYVSIVGVAEAAGKLTLYRHNTQVQLAA